MKLCGKSSFTSLFYLKQSYILKTKVFKTSTDIYIVSVRLSVIVRAFNRKTYVLDAVKSALNQTIGRDEYEIIVLKNFFDDSIDSFLDSNNVRSVITDELNPSKNSIEALEIANGDIACFLDDDDLFLPHKLKTVLSNFSADKELVYYHNFFSEIDDDNIIRKARLMGENHKDLVFQTDNYNIARKKELYRYYSYYNTSCISVRKEDLISAAKRNKQLLVPPSDATLFYLSCLAGKRILISGDILNAYRVHQNSITFSEASESGPKEKKKRAINFLESSYGKYKSTFIAPLILHNLTVSKVDLFVSYEGVAKPSVKTILMYIYYSIKKQDRFKMLLVLMLYIGILDRNRFLRIDTSRRKKRLQFAP